jgi:hypothetical protein
MTHPPHNAAEKFCPKDGDEVAASGEYLLMQIKSGLLEIL